MKYQVNLRWDEKKLEDLTDDEFNQVINRQPVHFNGASTIGCRSVSWEIWDEISRRAEARKAKPYYGSW